MQLTRQGVRDLDSLDRKKPYVPPTLTNHVCRQWRWFKPPKDAPEDATPEIRCVVCKKLWHGSEKAAVAPQVASLEKIVPGVKKRVKKEKSETLTKPTLKAPVV